MADPSLIDAASVCSPPACHAANCLPLIEAGVSVLCEKPLEVKLAAAEALAAVVRRKRALFMVGYVHRFFGPVVELTKLVREGRLGRPILFRNIYAQHGDMRGNSNVDPKLVGGGSLAGNGSHSIDLCRLLVGEPTHAQAMGAAVAQDIAVEDVAIMQLSMDNKAFAEIASSYSLHFGAYDIEWHGTAGAAFISYKTPPGNILRYHLVGEKEPRVIDCSTYSDLFTCELTHFLECVRTGATPSVTVEDGLKAARVLDAAYRSMRQGGVSVGA